MILRDFLCDACGAEFERLVSAGETPVCECGSTARSVVSTLHVFTTIVPTTTTSKRYKAGYVHQFRNRPAEKISVSVPSKVGAG